MAAGFAKWILGSRASKVDSAGIDPPTRGSANPHAIEALRRLKIDISGHVARHFDDLQLQDYDCVVAMSPTIAESLGSRSSLQKSLVIWTVPDPYGQGLDGYLRCGDRLRDLLLGFLAEDMRTRRVDLREYISEKLGQLDRKELEPSHIDGVVGTVVKAFETLLRNLLGYFLWSEKIDYETRLKKHVKGKSLDKLTLGEVIHCLKQLKGSAAVQLTLEAEKILGGVNSLRKPQFHLPMPEHKRTLEDNARELLVAVRDAFDLGVLNSPLMLNRRAF